ncbi:MAG: hypothetical protein AB7O73_11035 [Bacteroidia bacterium]
MKKTITLFALALTVSGAVAQENNNNSGSELKSKKGEMILPEAGDWGLAIDATPFLNYFGNFFGKTANNNAPSFTYLTNAQTISGKYFVDAQTAYRGSLRIGLGGATERNMVADVLKSAAISPTANGWPSSAPMVENTWKASNTTIGLAAGMEKRKGKTRLQGYYGGEVGIYMNMSKDKFTYGNALQATTTPSLNVNVTGADEFTNPNAYGNVGNNVAPAPLNGLIGDARVTERKNGTVISFGIRGFIGAEYFFLPKMSFGGEFGWGIGMSSTGKSKTTWEGVGNNGGPGSPNTVGSAEIESSKAGGWGLDTDNKNSVWGPTGSIRFNLYF